MTPRDWRKTGYRTIIRDDTAYLFRSQTDEVIAAPLVNGQWPSEGNVNATPWRRWSRDDLSTNHALLDDFRATAATCYCDQKGTDLCDYCAGRRRSPWLD